MNNIAELKEQLIFDLEDLHVSYAYKHAIEDLNLDPETALAYAKNSYSSLADFDPEQ